MTELHGERSLVFPARAIRAMGLLVAIALVALLSAVGTAHAAYGEYKVLLAEPYEQGPRTLGAQLAAFPEIKQVDYADTASVVPTAAELAKYDIVVSVGDSSYEHSVEWGDALASYVDGGGVVVRTAYDTWEGIDEGFWRFESGGYQALLRGDNVNKEVELATVDTSSPLMTGVGKLTSLDNTESAAAPGATVVATWTDGANAVAVKGRVVDISAFLGDGYGTPEFTGNYGRIIYNAVRVLGPQPPPVIPPPVVIPAPPSNVIKLGKLKLDKKKGTAALSVTVPGAGSLVISGKGVKKTTTTTTAAGAVNLTLKLVGKAQKTLLESGKAKVKAKLAFTPTGGTAGTLEKKLTLKKTVG